MHMYLTEGFIVYDLLYILGSDSQPGHMPALQARSPVGGM